MSHKVLVPTHRVDKLRIFLSLPANHADHFSQCCSQLFHTELKKLFDRVLSRLDTGGKTLRVVKPLVIDLGELPACAFEHTFSQRLKVQLERKLRQLLSELDIGCPPEGVTHHIATEGLEELKSVENIDELLRINPEFTLGKLALACLEYSGSSQLHRNLPSSRLKELCQKWVPVLVVKGRLTPATLQLCALYYCQVLLKLKVKLTELGIVQSAYTSYEQQVLIKLFKEAFQFTDHMKIKANWLTELWRNEKVRECVQPQLSVPQIALLNKGIAKDNPRVSIPDAVPQTALLNKGIAKDNPRVSIPDAVPQTALLNKGIAKDNPRVSIPDAVPQTALLNKGITKDNPRVSIPDAVPQTALLYKGIAKDNPRVSIPDAGLSLLWPFLPGLFRQLELIQDNAFLNRDMQLKAASCIAWLSQQHREQNSCSPIVLLMCGLAGEASSESAVLDEATQAFLARWLEGLPRALPGTWQKLCSGDIQQWFLQRPGWLSTDDEEPVLYIAPDSFDVLLNDWPWPINMIALPWLEMPIKILWAKPE